MKTNCVNEWVLPLSVVATRYLATVLLCAALLATTSAWARSVEIQVLESDTRLWVAGAAVCIESGTDGSLYAAGVTGANGKATFSGLPDAPLQVVASKDGRGASRGLGGPTLGGLALFTVALHAAGGPRCEPGDGTPEAIGPGTFVHPDAAYVRSEFQEMVDSYGRIVTLDPRVPPPPPPPPSPQFCFGALGAGCGGTENGIPFSALCSHGRCNVNVGSWEHDQCCWRNPNGMACRNGPLDGVTGNDQNCVDSWQRAQDDLLRFTWPVEVDFTQPNTAGRVEHAVYCAPSGTQIAVGDGDYCCLRSASPPPDKATSRFANSPFEICN